MTKYQYVYEQVKKEIEDEVFKSSEKLPSEKVIAEKYDVSVNTVRKALSVLIEKGYIVSRHGSGYFVSAHKNFSSLKLRSLASHSLEKNIESKVLSFEIVQANKEQAENLNIQENEVIFKIERLRIINGEPSILENTIVPVKYFPSLKREVFDKSFYNYIEEESDHRIDRAIKDISPILPSQDVCEKLNVAVGKPLLVVENYVFLTNGEQFEYSYNIHIDNKMSIAVNHI